MRVLLTGAYGRCGTAILDHLDEKYDFTCVDCKRPPEKYEKHDHHLVDVTDYEATRAVVNEHDAVIHLAGAPETDSSWTVVLENNIIGMYNILEATCQGDVDSFVFASSNHVVGMVETDEQPELYDGEAGVVVDHTTPVRPDSYYGVSKVFGEALGRYYAEREGSPHRFYSLRICNVAPPDTDSPTKYAESLRDNGLDPKNDRFQRKLNRRKAMWHSRRDFAQLVECCLLDNTVEFDIFHGVSDNCNRWFDLEHARTVLGYRPKDRANEHPVPDYS